MNENEWINIKFQDGPVKKNGINGCQANDVVNVLLQYLVECNYYFPCRENALAITKLQEAAMWLEERTRLREVQHVEGTHHKHRGIRIGGHYLPFSQEAK